MTILRVHMLLLLASTVTFGLFADAARLSTPPNPNAPRASLQDAKNDTANNFLQGTSFLGHGMNILYSNPLVGANNNGGAPEGLTKAQSIIEFAPSDRSVK